MQEPVTRVPTRKEVIGILKFYGEIRNYDSSPGCNGDEGSWSRIDADRGFLARKTLERLGEK